MTATLSVLPARTPGIFISVLDLLVGATEPSAIALVLLEGRLLGSVTTVKVLAALLDARRS